MSVISERPSPQSSSWRVVVFTTSGGAFAFLDAFLQSLNYRVVGVVTTPGPRIHRSTDYLQVVAAVDPRIDVFVSTHRRRWAPLLAPLRPDLIVSVAFPYRIPDDVIALPRLGAINGHDSLLPKYRGPNPQGWVFRNGDTETGYTIHRLTREFDAGPILAQIRVPVLEDDDFETLFRRLIPEIPAVFADAFLRLANRDPGEPQDHSAASAAPFFEETWRDVDWSRSARTIHNQVRSLFELPGQPAGAVGNLAGQRTRLLKTELIVEEHRNDDRSRPGNILAEERDTLIVQCGDVPLRLVSWQPDALT